MFRNEKQTREELINPALELRGWKKEYIKIEQTPGRFEVINGRERRVDKRVDYLLQLPIFPKDAIKPVLLPIALIEAKKESELPAFALGQVRDYTNATRLFNEDFRTRERGTSNKSAVFLSMRIIKKSF
jgi:type I site-specific restriction endonuclease